MVGYVLRGDWGGLLLVLQARVRVGEVVFAMAIRYVIFRIVPDARQFLVDFLPLIAAFQKWLRHLVLGVHVLFRLLRVGIL